MPPNLIVRGVGDLLAVVPYLLGYHPHDGLVLVATRRHKILCVLCGDDPALLAAVAAEHGPDGTFLIEYGPGSAGVNHEVDVRVHDGHYWRPGDPDQKRRVPTGSVAAATATFHGLRARPSRAAMLAELAAVTGPEREAMTAAIRRAETRMVELDRTVPDEERFTRLVRRAGTAAVRAAERRHRARGRLTDDATAWLTVLLVSPAVFAYAWERLGDDQQALWTDLVRRADPRYVAAPACLLGYLTWRDGQGTLARMAIDRALTAEPDHEMARLLDDLVGQAAPGRVTPRIRPSGAAPAPGPRSRTWPGCEPAPRPASHRAEPGSPPSSTRG